MIQVRDSTQPSRPPPGKAIKLTKGKKNGIVRKHLVRSITQDTEHSLTKGPFVPPRQYDIIWDPEFVETYMAKWENKGYLKLKPECLKWSPFLVARTMKSDGLSQDTPETPLETPLDETPSDLGDLVALANGDTPKTALKTTRTPRNKQLDVVSGSVVASPALNLFDEPIGELHTSALQRDPDELPALLEDPIPGSRPRRGEEEEDYEEALPETSVRRKRRMKGVDDEDEIIPRRSGRRSTVMSMSTSPSQASNISEPMKSARKGRPPKNRTPSSNSHINGNGKLEPIQPQLDDKEPSIADDEALAKRLAMEDDLPRRQLRSRSVTSQEIKTLAQVQSQKRATQLPPTPPVPSSRKRKRVDTSPEDLSSPPDPPPLRRRFPGTNGRRPSVASPPPFIATPNGSQRRSTRLTNGITMIDVTPSPELHRTRSSAVKRRVTSPAEEFNGQPDMSQTQPPAPATDVKYEDMGTPLTGMSRQSAPSDDTVYVAEDHRLKETPVSPVTFEAPQTNQVPASVGGEEDAVGDVDAEGEDDVDAEGEPDEDLDVDAEGEPDDGEDIDADGEVDDGLDVEGEVVMMV